jgi:alkaline phosphatase
MKLLLWRRVFAIVVLFLWSSLGSPAWSAEPARSPEPAKNIILFIGDGMGVEVLALLHDYNRVTGRSRPFIEKIMEEGHLSLAHVSSADKLVIDSAAAATALATGKKTINGMVAMTPDGGCPPTILELAKGASRSTGIVTTTSLSHATPACFVAHAEERKSEAEIAEQMVEAGVTVMMGGGLAYWIPQGRTVSQFAPLSPISGAEDESEREDDTNLLEKSAAAGYRIVYNRSQLLAEETSAKLIGLFAAAHIPYALDRTPDDHANAPSLAEMTRAALERLSLNENGFFLMVEGGRIDHAAHNHDIAALLGDALDFDQALGVAYEFARGHAQTALFVTADHATAAPSLTARYVDRKKKTIYPDEDSLRKIARQDASFEALLLEMGKEMSPAALRSWVSEHTAVAISVKESAEILRAGPLTAFHVIKPRYRKFGYPMQALGRILGEEYMIAWATAEHYSEPAFFISFGEAAKPQNGYLEQADVFDIMKTTGGL